MILETRNENSVTTRILLLSAYDAPSHRGWCEGLQHHLAEFEWSYLTLPARHFQWRIRGNPLSWSATRREVLSAHYDVVLATSMVDLATLCGLFSNIARAHKVIYFHENQFAYPESEWQRRQAVEPMMVNLYSALAADRVVFNSDYNRSSFLEGARRFLQRMPDHAPTSILKEVELRSETLAVPIADIAGNGDGSSRLANSLVWNHRWEYDKNPQAFFAACTLLKSWGIPFKLIVMGQQFRNWPGEFDRAKSDFYGEIVCWGEQSRKEYLRWLARGEWVVSTAVHEFQGVAVMEAVRAGCIPVVPDRLSFPQWFDSAYRFGQTAEELAQFLRRELAVRALKPPKLEGLSWSELIPHYRRLLQPQR